MTREEKAKILDYAIERSFVSLDTTAHSPQALKDLVDAIAGMECLMDMERTRFCVKAAEEAKFQIGDIEEPAPVEPEKPTPVNPESKEAEPDEPQYKMEEVRAALAKARSKGINVSEIIASFGVSSFPQITKEQYPAVMRELESRGA